MIRWLQVASVLAVTASAAFVFQVKYRSEDVAKRAADLQRAVDEEQEAISLLKAEWSYLIQPLRVQELIERHQGRFELVPVLPEQIGTFADLPMRRSADPAPRADMANRAAPAFELEPAGPGPARIASGSRP
ncbi:MAG: hypothetical protein E2O93_03425 [Alphaproteobacteria bacterium]|nr:MAG: hypothetical protein E2O93_03425 [Alphaproteobacteria bacterium]